MVVANTIGVLRWHGVSVAGPFFDVNAAHGRPGRSTRHGSPRTTAQLPARSVSVIGEKGEEQLGMNLVLDEIVKMLVEG